MTARAPVASTSAPPAQASSPPPRDARARPLDRGGLARQGVVHSHEPLDRPLRALARGPHAGRGSGGRRLRRASRPHPPGARAEQARPPSAITASAERLGDDRRLGRRRRRGWGRDPRSLGDRVRRARRRPDRGATLSSKSFAASDTKPALLAVDAGRVLEVDGAPEVRPLSRLDVVLWRADGTQVGVLARLRDVLPGRATFGLTGRGPDGQLLPPRRLCPARRRLSDGARAAEPPPPALHAAARRVASVYSPFGDGGRSTGLAPSREPVRDRARAAPPRRVDVRHRRQPRQRPERLQEGRRGLGSRRHGRRLDERLPGLPRHAQRGSRAVEGRHPVPPRRHARRGQGARDVDDVEVRADGHPVRRREGRRRRATRRSSRAPSSSA